MFAFVTQDIGGNYGDSISCLIDYDTATKPKEKEVEIFTDYVSYSQLSNIVFNTAEFVNDLFETQEIFDNRQISLMELSNSIFKGSRSLNSFEENALDVAFKNSLLDTPTLKGRR